MAGSEGVETWGEFKRMLRSRQPEIVDLAALEDESESSRSVSLFEGML